MILNQIKPISRLLLTICLLYSIPIQACDVPVFRYALERWPPDLYEVLVFHKKPLSAEYKLLVERIEKASHARGGPANYVFQTIDLNGKLSEQRLDLWKSFSSPELPYLVINYPRQAGIHKIILSGRLTSKALQILLDSPVRREIVGRISEGQVALWILLESGDKKKNDASAQLLQSELMKLEKSLNLPDMQSGGDSRLINNIIKKQPLFSIIRLSQLDSVEALLTATLLQSEPDLNEYSAYPMVFPVFGRGRILYALVGDGINAQNIREACGYLTGPCSCEIKALNQGTDLLIAADWDRLIAGTLVESEELPRLTGLSEFIPRPEKAETSSVSAPRLSPEKAIPQLATPADTLLQTRADSSKDSLIVLTTENSAGESLVRNSISVILLGILVIVIASLLILRKKSD